MIHAVAANPCLDGGKSWRGGTSWTESGGRTTTAGVRSWPMPVTCETWNAKLGAKVGEGDDFFANFVPLRILYSLDRGRPAHFDKHEFVLARRIVAFLLRFEHTTTAEFRSLWKVGTLDLTLWARVIEMTFMFGACKLVIGITVYTGVFDQVIENLLPL